jgi:hypothetical protein
VSEANLLNAPTFKISDRKVIVNRVHEALLADPDCRYDFKGMWLPTHAELGNWEARQHCLVVSQSYTPAEPDSPSSLVVDVALEPVSAQE